MERANPVGALDTRNLVKSPWLTTNKVVSSKTVLRVVVRLFTARYPLLPQLHADTFYHVAGIAWEHLHPGSRRAIRHASVTGRTLHDSRLTDLRIRLGHSKPDMYDDVDYSADEEDWNGIAASSAAGPPTPAELRSTLDAVVHRGARLKVLRLRFITVEEGHRPVHEREEQLLTALGSVSGCPVTDLRLSGGVPLSSAVASAVASLVPGMSNLCLYFQEPENDLPQGDRDGEQASKYYFGAIQLLTLCGPRLRKLGLWGGVQHWPGMTFQALSLCTALRELELEAGSGEFDASQGKGAYLGSPVQESNIVAAIAQLTSLQSLEFRTTLDPEVCSPAALSPYATSLARLSALTALTRLELALSPCYEHDIGSWSKQEGDGERRPAWCAAREAHRTSLLSALRAMPQLQHLDCPTLWLHPSEAASLTALTSLSVGGLYPPLPPAGEGSSGTLPLPPQLIQLTLNTAASPRLLASLQVPTTLTALHLRKLSFGMSDVTPDNRLLPETVAAVGPALQLISSLRSADPVYKELVIEADSFQVLLWPCAGVTEGHVEWLRHLTALQGVEAVKLYSLELRLEDMCCLAQTLGCKKRLSIVDCSFPVAAITVLLGLEVTEELQLDLFHVAGVTRSALETALTVLCLQARKLRRVACTNCQLDNCQAVQAAIMAKLRSRGQEGLTLTIAR